MESTLGPKPTDPHPDDVLAPKELVGAEDALAKLAEATRAAVDLQPRMAGADFSAGPRVASPSVDSVPLANDLFVGAPDSREPKPREIKSRGRRAGRSLLRFLLAVSIGAAGTLAWQSYGDAARQMVATYIPALGPLSSDLASSLGVTQQLPAPEDEPLAAVPANVAAPAQPAALAPATTDPVAPPPSPELMQQIEAMARDLAALRQSMEQLAAGHDQMARSLAKLRTAEENIQHKQPAPPPAAARKPQATLPPPRPIVPSSATPSTLPPPRSVSQSPASPPALSPPRPISQSSAAPSPQPLRPAGSMP